MTKIAVTMGDPSGIGPEVVIKAIAQLMDNDRVSFVVAGEYEVMNEAAARFGDARMKKLWAGCPKVGSLEDTSGHKNRKLVLVSGGNYSLSDLKPGDAGATEGKAAWRSLRDALTLVTRNKCDALVTAPVSKAALMACGFPEAGHTQWLGKKTGARAVMMLVAGRLRVVPVTIHVPLSAVPGDLSTDKVVETIVVVDSELRSKFKIKNPRIAVSGLNPHAGESNMLGTEEKQVIAPGIEEAKKRGIMVAGPLPADAMFTPAARKGYDAAICMYHDQAMIPVKTIGMDKAVNVTLGLPLVRTSPAHGTAPDIAWKGLARPASMVAAIKLALRLARRKTAPGKKRI